MAMQNLVPDAADAQIFIHGLNGIHVFVVQLEIPNVGVLPNAIRCHALWDNAAAALQLPLQSDLRVAFVVLLGNFLQAWISEDISVFKDCCAIAWIAERRKHSNANLAVLAKLDDLAV